MAKLTADAVRAREQAAVYDDAAADARAERDEDGGPAAGAAAHPEFAEGGTVRVVPGAHAQARQNAEGIVQVEYAPVQVHAAVDHAGGVHRAGHADAEAKAVVPRKPAAGHAVLHAPRDVRQNVLAAVFRARGKLPLFQKLARLAEQTELDRRSADVDTESVFHKLPHLLCVFAGIMSCVIGEGTARPGAALAQ